MSSMRETEQKLLHFLNENKIWIGIFVAAAIGIPTGIWVFKEKKRTASEYTWFRMAAISGELIEAEQKNVRDDALYDTIDSYNEIKSSQPTTDATPWLLHQLGDAQFETKNFDDAIKTYSEFVKKYPRHSAISLVRLSLGYAYEEKGMTQEALEQFEAIKAGDNPFLKSQRALNMGRCYEKLGSKELAKQAYNEVIEFSYGTNIARLAQYRLEKVQ